MTDLLLVHCHCLWRASATAQRSTCRSTCENRTEPRRKKQRIPKPWWFFPTMTQHVHFPPKTYSTNPSPAEKGMFVSSPAGMQIIAETVQMPTHSPHETTKCNQTLPLFDTGNYLAELTVALGACEVASAHLSAMPHVAPTQHTGTRAVGVVFGAVAKKKKKKIIMTA